MSGEHIHTFFNSRVELEAELISSLGGGLGMSSRWWKLMIELNKMGMPLTVGVCESIEANNLTIASQAQSAWRTLKNRPITIDMLCIALSRAGLGLWSEKLNTIALYPQRALVFEPAAAIPPSTYEFKPTVPTMALRLTDMVAASKKRIGDPLDKLEDDACLVVKVSCVNVTDDSKLADLDFEICGAYKGLPAAKREANLRLDEEIQAAGGDETRVCNMYTVWPFRAYASAARREVKDRTRDAGQKASTK